MVPGVYDDAYNEALRLRDEKNYTFIHPFDDENVIAGQGTIGIEIMNEMPDVDAVVCAIGGGGLISGVACAIKSLNPNIKVYGVQAEGAPSMVESIKNGELFILTAFLQLPTVFRLKNRVSIHLNMLRSMLTIS